MRTDKPKTYKVSYTIVGEWDPEDSSTRNAEDGQWYYHPDFATVEEVKPPFEPGWYQLQGRDRSDKRGIIAWLSAESCNPENWHPVEVSDL